MSIYGNAVRRPITTIMIFVGLMVMGIYSLNKLPIDFYPDIDFPAISVVTTYTGSTASDIRGARYYEKDGAGRQEEV